MLYAISNVLLWLICTRYIVCIVCYVYTILQNMKKKNKKKTVNIRFFKKISQTLGVVLLNDLKLGQICYSQSWINCFKFLQVDQQGWNLYTNDSGSSNFYEKIAIGLYTENNGNNFTWFLLMYIIYINLRIMLWRNVKIKNFIT